MRQLTGMSPDITGKNKQHCNWNEFVNIGMSHDSSCILFHIDGVRGDIGVGIVGIGVSSSSLSCFSSSSCVLLSKWSISSWGEAKFTWHKLQNRYWYSSDLW